VEETGETEEERPPVGKEVEAMLLRPSRFIQDSPVQVSEPFDYGESGLSNAVLERWRNDPWRFSSEFQPLL
jgi:hypothetical protein